LGHGSSSAGSKTLLLFVIRDHVRGTTPLEPLTRAVEADLEKIWSGISKVRVGFLWGCSFARVKLIP
jgi:hypothetical protein